ncbi:MAG: hypothetical protein H6850_04320 [Alphaproteobacteria bacterium]|nr:MAG: hypothetical protein H6850_04320 [Alphaproteobacteria bacterium]
MSIFWPAVIGMIVHIILIKMVAGKCCDKAGSLYILINALIGTLLGFLTLLVLYDASYLYGDMFRLFLSFAGGVSVGDFLLGMWSCSKSCEVKSMKKKK